MTHCILRGFLFSRLPFELDDIDGSFSPLPPEESMLVTTLKPHCHRQERDPNKAVVDPLIRKQ